MPMAWQPRHLEKEISPAAASCAEAENEARDIDTPKTDTAIQNPFILLVEAITPHLGYA
jgi:hypothetical protein